MTKVLFNLKIDPHLRAELKLVGALRHVSMSALLLQYAARLTREEADRYPAAFFYLHAGGSIAKAVDIAREFGSRPLSDEDKTQLRQMAETDDADDFILSPNADEELPVPQKGGIR